MTAPEPTMIAPLAGALVVEATKRGVPASALLDALGVTTEQLGDPERRIPSDAVYAAWELAMRATRDDGLPIAVARLASVQRYGVLGYALYTSPSFLDNVTLLRRYHDLINSTGAWSMQREGDRVLVEWRRPAHRLGVRAGNEQVLASTLAFCVEAFGERIPILEARFAHAPPRDVSAHEAHFRAPLRWNARENAVVVHESLLDRRPLMSDPLLSQHFQASVERAIARVAPPSSWAARVAWVVSNHLPKGLPTLEVVARELGTSERTARRRLSIEETTFAALVERVQRERAEELVKGPTPLRDVAFALGFADATAFSRAYRRWTGISPSEARTRGALKDGAAPRSKRD